MTPTKPLGRPCAVPTPSPLGQTTATTTRSVKDPTIFRCHGCGGWITAHRMDRFGCPTCRTLAARS